nr:DRAP deaminase [Polyrhizophydium stewartii]
MQRAVDEAAKSPPAEAAYCVGAVLVAPPADDGGTSDHNAGTVLASGFSRELPGNTHAEQVCLAKLASPDAARGTHVYSTMEPCSLRLSGNVPCARRLIDAGVARVFIGVLEPPDLVANCSGVEMLQAAGIEVVYLDGFRGVPAG